MKQIVIVGTGGCAREVHQIIEDLNLRAPAWEFLGFLDDHAALHDTLVHGFPVLGGIEWLAGAGRAQVSVAVGIGNPAVRRKLVGRIRALCAAPEFATLVHPAALIGNRVIIGSGTLIWQGVIVSTDAVLGEQVIVNAATSIAHDARIGDYVTFAPAVRLAGNVTLEQGADLGIACSVIQGKTIGAWSIIGAGAVVIDHIDANVTAVGVPARVIRARTADWHTT